MLHLTSRLCYPPYCVQVAFGRVQTLLVSCERLTSEQGSYLGALWRELTVFTFLTAREDPEER